MKIKNTTEGIFSKDEILLTKNTLQTRYDSIIGLDSKGFFLTLADYVKFVQGSQLLAEICSKSLHQEGEKDIRKFNLATKKFQEELQAEEIKLLRLARTIPEEKIARKIKEYEVEKLTWDSGSMFSHSKTREEDLNDYLSSILRSIYELGYKKETSVYTNFTSPKNDLGTNLMITQGYPAYSDALKTWKHVLERSCWSAWEHLKNIYELVYKNNERPNKTDSAKSMNLQEKFIYRLSVESLDKALKGQKNPFFNMEESLTFLSRVHSLLIEKLNLKIALHLEPFKIPDLKKSLTSPTSESSQKPKTVPSFEASFIDKEHKLIIEHVPSRKKFILATLRFDSRPDRIIKELFESQDQILRFVKLKDKLELPAGTSFKKILTDCGFKGSIKKIFLDVSKKSVRIKTKIYQTDLKKINVTEKEVLVCLEQFSSKRNRVK